MSSNKKRNAFYYFMTRRKEELEADGMRFPGGLKEVADFVSDEWKAMSADEKKVYDPYKRSMSEAANVIPKFANPTEKWRWEQKEKKELEKSLAIEIGILVQNEKIKTMRFIVIDFNVWGTDNTGLYMPAEIGLVAFSLSDGIIDNYGTIIDPGKIPLGMGFEIVRVADNLDLPRPTFDVHHWTGMTLKYILKCIFWFVNKHKVGGSPGYLFCRRESTDIVNGCLEWLCKKNNLTHKFKVYPFEYLVFELAKLNKGKQADSNDKAALIPPKLPINNVENKAGAVDIAKSPEVATATPLSGEDIQIPIDNYEETRELLEETTEAAVTTETEAESSIKIVSSYETGETTYVTEVEAGISEMTIFSDETSGSTSVPEESQNSVIALFDCATASASAIQEAGSSEISAPIDDIAEPEKVRSSDIGKFLGYNLRSLPATSKRQWSFKFWKERPPMTAEEREREKWKRVQPEDPFYFTEEETAYYRKLLAAPARHPLAEVKTVLDSVALYRIKHFACFHHLRNNTFVHKCVLSKVNYYVYNAFRYILPKIGMAPISSAHYPLDHLAEHEEIVHCLMMKNWGLEERRYASYLDPEKRKEKEKANKAMLKSCTFNTKGIAMEDLPLCLVPPLFRPRQPSPTTPTYVLIDQKSGNKTMKKK